MQGGAEGCVCVGGGGVLKGRKDAESDGGGHPKRGQL